MPVPCTCAVPVTVSLQASGKWHDECLQPPVLQSRTSNIGLSQAAEDAPWSIAIATTPGATMLSDAGGRVRILVGEIAGRVPPARTAAWKILRAAGGSEVAAWIKVEDCGTLSSAHDGRRSWITAYYSWSRWQQVSTRTLRNTYLRISRPSQRARAQTGSWRQKRVSITPRQLDMCSQSHR